MNIVSCWTRNASGIQWESALKPENTLARNAFLSYSHSEKLPSSMIDRLSKAPDDEMFLINRRRLQL